MKFKPWMSKGDKSNFENHWIDKGSLSKSPDKI